MSNNIIKVTKDTEFTQHTGKGWCIVDFFATWCRPCMTFSPIFEEVTSSNPDLKAIMVDMTTPNSIAGIYNVMSIPTVILFKDGVEINRYVGSMSKSELQAFISSNCTK